MGFFSDILKTVAPIVGTFLGVPAPAPTTTAVGTRPKPTTSELVRRSPELRARIDASGTQVTPGAACPTQGALRRRTIVETFDPDTGDVCRSETFKGAPAVMQSDVAAANRLNRALRRLNKQQPRKLVKQTTLSRLKEDVIEGALRGAGQPCPNGNGSSNG